MVCLLRIFYIFHFQLWSFTWQSAKSVHNFVDDTTFSELIPSTGSVSNMPSHLTSLLTWTANNDMQINTSKTKEMVLGSLISINLSLFWPHQVQLNASPHSDYWGSTLTQTSPGPHALTGSSQKLANGSINWSSSREREFHINSFSISILQ